MGGAGGAGGAAAMVELSAWSLPPSPTPRLSGPQWQAL